MPNVGLGRHRPCPRPFFTLMVDRPSRWITSDPRWGEGEREDARSPESRMNKRVVPLGYLLSASVETRPLLCENDDV